ncbi:MULTISPECIES: IclR family transcriptional regulator domain-containing protein [Kocuria]|uniref:Glycerol operon regulatory protein n=1 Tax=Kocuria subflava TaxID=1736139 RepID=A0A846TUW0_9MICC|nr:MULTISPECIES: IclR family transcriptional regulator C-terminal domain-containing protein [Kocuria]NKE09524.1 helix-turn-helix domain-containing protein [Kocuria subflava]
MVPDASQGPEATTREGGGYFVQSLARGLAVIAAFDDRHPAMTLSDVARRTGLTRATARRFLLTLEELGYVRSDGRQFELTAKVLELGYSYLSALSLPELVTPHLRKLSDQVQESCSVAVLDGPDIVYVARVQMRHIMNVAISVGTRFPAHATSMGRVLLADLSNDDAVARCGQHLGEHQLARTVSTPHELIRRLDEVRRRGYAVVDQELEAGLRSVAVPLKDSAGKTVAAANVSMRVGASPAADDPVGQILPALQQCAAAVHQDLVASAV